MRESCQNEVCWTVFLLLARLGKAAAKVYDGTAGALEAELELERVSVPAVGQRSTESHSHQSQCHHLPNRH